MRKLVLVISAVFLICAFAPISFLHRSEAAISEAEQKKLMENEKFREAEKALELVLKNAKATLEGTMLYTYDLKLEELEKDQKEWLEKGRETEVKEYIKGDIPDVDAYTNATLNRIQDINEHIGFDFEMDQEIPQYFVGTYLRLDTYPESESIKVDFDPKTEILSVEFFRVTDSKPEIMFNAKGRLFGATAILQEVDGDRFAKIVFLGDGFASITGNNVFLRYTVGVTHPAFFNGAYKLQK